MDQDVSMVKNVEQSLLATCVGSVQELGRNIDLNANKLLPTLTIDVIDNNAPQTLSTNLLYAAYQLCATCLACAWYLLDICLIIACQMLYTA